MACFARTSVLQPQHKRHTMSPTFLFNHLHVIFLSHQFVYFNKAAFYASSVGDSSSCMRTRCDALANIWNAMMQPLRLDKSLHCCPVKVGCPRHAVVHKGHILHDFAPWTHSNPINHVIRSVGKRAAFFPGKQPNIWFSISHTSA